MSILLPFVSRIFFFNVIIQSQKNAHIFCFKSEETGLLNLKESKWVNLEDESTKSNENKHVFDGLFDSTRQKCR